MSARFFDCGLDMLEKASPHFSPVCIELGE
jgi:hypothetical protein